MVDQSTNPPTGSFQRGESSLALLDHDSLNFRVADGLLGGIDLVVDQLIPRSMRLFLCCSSPLSPKHPVNLPAIESEPFLLCSCLLKGK